MTVTVLPIIDSDPKPAAPLAKVMNERLSRMALELQNTHLKELNSVEPLFEDVVIYLSYNSKYAIRWKIMNDVPEQVTRLVSGVCERLGYLPWKSVSIYHFKGKS